MEVFYIYDGDELIGEIEADDRKQAKKKFFAENKDWDDKRLSEKRTKCTFGVRRSKK